MTSLPDTRLMLLLPAGFDPAVAATLARAGDVAAAIAAGDDAALARIAQALQPAGVAVLGEGQAPKTLDGAHLFGLAALKAALPGLKPARIAGAGGLSSRHDAMEAGEMGADYVLFGDGGMPFSHTLELVGWWSELFEVPCVGCAASREEAVALAGAGADFVALGGAVLAEDAIRGLNGLLRGPESVA